MEQWEMMIHNGTATLGESLAVSSKTQHTVTIWHSNLTPWYFLWGAEHLCPHQNLHTNVSSSFINYCPKLEATVMFFIMWTDKTIIYSFNGYFSVLKRNELSSHETTCGNFKCILLSESSSPSEKSIYYMIPNTYILYDILGKVRLWRQTDPWLPKVGWEKDE